MLNGPRREVIYWPGVLIVFPFYFNENIHKVLNKDLSQVLLEFSKKNRLSEYNIYSNLNQELSTDTILFYTKNKNIVKSELVDINDNKNYVFITNNNGESRKETYHNDYYQIIKVRNEK